MTETGEFVAVIGATGGIGSELCQVLHARGARLWLMARDVARLDALRAQLGADGEALDARDFEAVASSLQRAEERHGSLSGAVNLCGSILLKPAHATSNRDLDETVAQNLGTAFALLRAAAGRMAKRGGGAIVLMSSAAAHVGLPNHEAISAAKAAVSALARSAAATYAAQGVRVNTVSPGLVHTPLSARLVASEAALARSAAMHPLGRIGSAREVAEAVAYLLSPSAAWITGQDLGVDGGLAALRPRA
jgi:NAD(P)-dependent dehydrogenase (short-subunit alcohol dehydrogenase family)